MVDFRQLRYFRAVADELHFARAAARLGIEQSPLSRQIQGLEADLKVRLFERTRRSTWLTAAGERFALDARRILADVDASVLAVRAFAQAGQVLRLGLSEGFASAAFGGLLRACETAEPRLPVILMERPLAEMSRLTIVGGLDAMLAPEKAATSELESRVAWTEGLTLLTPMTDDCHHGGAIWLRSMGDRPWILPDPKTLPGFARQTEDLLACKGLKVWGATAASPATMIRMVAAGLGSGLLPRSLAVTTDEVVMHPLRDGDARLTTWLTIRREDRSPLIATLQDLVQSAAEELHFSA